jgi:hypothetical protein
VVTDHRIIHETYIGLRGTRLLVLPGIAKQIPVEFFPATVEPLNFMLRAKFLNTTFRTH